MGGRRTAHLVPLSGSFGREPFVALGQAQGQGLLHLHHAARRALDSRDRQARCRHRLRCRQAARRRDPRSRRSDRDQRPAHGRRQPAAATGRYARRQPRAQLPRVSARCAAEPGADALDPCSRLARAGVLRPATIGGQEAPAGRPLPLRGVRDGGVGRAAACASHLCRARRSGQGRTRSRCPRRATRPEEIGAAERRSERCRMRGAVGRSGDGATPAGG
jgi:hypothetical protein